MEVVGEQTSLQMTNFINTSDRQVDWQSLDPLEEKTSAAIKNAISELETELPAT